MRLIWDWATMAGFLLFVLPFWAAMAALEWCVSPAARAEWRAQLRYSRGQIESDVKANAQETPPLMAGLGERRGTWGIVTDGKDVEVWSVSKADGTRLTGYRGAGKTHSRMTLADYLANRESSEAPAIANASKTDEDIARGVKAWAAESNASCDEAWMRLYGKPFPFPREAREAACR